MIAIIASGIGCLVGVAAGFLWGFVQARKGHIPECELCTERLAHSDAHHDLEAFSAEYHDEWNTK